MPPSTDPPLTDLMAATDVMAMVLGLLAVIFLLLWRRDGERGMAWFAAAMGVFALMATTNERHLPTSAFVQASPWQIVLVLGLVALALGLIDYLHVDGARRRLAFTATVAPALAFAALVLYIGVTGAQVPRSLGQLPVALTFLSMGLLSAGAARREPGALHAVVAASFLAIPAIAVAIALARADGVSLRLFAFAPFLALGLTLLTASLLRRRRALEIEVARRVAVEAELTRLNSSLEQTVAERTADLHHLVAGLESFNRNVSHDLRGALGGIGGLARLADQALQRNDDALARRALPMIAERADQASQLMAALLSLARVGDATLQRQAVDLRQLVRQVVDQLTIEQGGQAMPQVEVSADMGFVDADPTLLKLVFANLIGNAVKFTRGANAGRVDIRAFGTPEGVTVQVCDNGVGFDAQAARRLFTPFVRLHDDQFEGHGVGLSIVRRAVERHGGRVWAEGQPGQGAVFSFSLPS